MITNTELKILNINTKHPLYKQEQQLRNEVLLRPIGVPDHAWEMKDETAWHFVAVSNKKVVACVVLAPTNEEKTEVQLMQMAVDTSLQKSGIGKLLVDELKSFASQNNIQRITCHARDYAVAFYLKQGFEIYGEPFEEVGIEHRHMEYNVI